jgi:hypothetical protein
MRDLASRLANRIPAEGDGNERRYSPAVCTAIKTKVEAGNPTTPAMAAGVADHVWTLGEIVGLLD